ncbi:MipA/OmpV family protein [Vibrio gallicus]|uniref:MipA/OmpV family protein n=1 Tax=Vibrio gallicus TaxID=190897 RepID=UPI0021C2E643|nr:MipA/OmpV family protein [Vibrio gallicus]
MQSHSAQQVGISYLSSCVIRPLIALLLGSGLLFSTAVYAEDISSSVAQSGSRLDSGGYFEVGVSALAINQVDVRDSEHDDVQPLLMLSGIYQYKGLFVELVHLSQDGTNLGYNFWNSEHWSLDFLAANLEMTWQRDDDSDLSSMNEAQKNAYLMSDESLYVGAGIRATRYWDDNYVFQFRAVSDYYNNQGFQSTVRLGKSWQVRNWNLYTLGGATYLSKQLTRNIYGVSAEEATSQFYQYQPGSAINYSLELGAAYPISQDFVFRSIYRITSISDEISESPFSKADYNSLFNVSISYVF